MAEHMKHTCGECIHSEICEHMPTLTGWDALNQAYCRAFRNAADVVEVETVAQMLCHALGDECPCNYGSSDEWLPEVCELQDECPDPKDNLGCWKQYIKHFGERRAE